MRKRFLLLLSLGFLTACGEEEETENLGQHYPASFVLATQLTSPKRLLTKQGEVMDPARVKAFADRHSEAVFDPVFLGPDTITFIDVSQAEYRGFLGRSLYTVQNTGNYIMFTASQETNVNVTAYQENLLHIQNTVSQYIILRYNEKQHPTGLPYTSSFKTKNQMIGAFQENKIQLHFLKGLIKTISPDTTKYSPYRFAFSNKLDVARLAQLGPNDTVLVEEYVLTGHLLK